MNRSWDEQKVAVEGHLSKLGITDFHSMTPMGRNPVGTVELWFQDPRAVALCRAAFKRASIRENPNNAEREVFCDQQKSNDQLKPSRMLRKASQIMNDIESQRQMQVSQPPRFQTFGKQYGKQIVDEKDHRKVYAYTASGKLRFTVLGLSLHNPAEQNEIRSYAEA